MYDNLDNIIKGLKIELTDETKLLLKKEYLILNKKIEKMYKINVDKIEPLVHIGIKYYTTNSEKISFNHETLTIKEISKNVEMDNNLISIPIGKKW